MDLIKKFNCLPFYLQFEGIHFEPRLFNNKTDDVRLVYEITSCDKDSKHYEEVKQFDCFNNPFLDGNKGFLYLVEGIESESDLSEAIDETLAFLKKHGFIPHDKCHICQHEEDWNGQTESIKCPLCERELNH